MHKADLQILKSFVYRVNFSDFVSRIQKQEMGHVLLPTNNRLSCQCLSCFYRLKPDKLSATGKRLWYACF